MAGEEKKVRSSKSAAIKYAPPTHAQIAKRAFELFIEQGRRDGHEKDHWLQAEYELLKLPVA